MGRGRTAAFRGKAKRVVAPAAGNAGAVCLAPAPPTASPFHAAYTPSSIIPPPPSLSPPPPLASVTAVEAATMVFPYGETVQIVPIVAPPPVDQPAWLGTVYSAPSFGTVCSSASTLCSDPPCEP